jgi:hypothetical protein
MGTLTVRVDDRLKADAEEACAALDITLSQVVRAALRDVIAGHRKAVASRPVPDRPFEPSRRLETQEDRLKELTALEGKNLLNKVTRAELKELRSRFYRGSR